MAIKKQLRGKAKRSSSRAAAGRKLKPAAGSRGLEAADVAVNTEDAAIADLVAKIREAGGVTVGAYRDPLGGRALVLATLPFRAIQPTPFQRDLSPTHTKRLSEKIDEAGAFLDPLIVVLGDDDNFWTPNGRHRLAAAKVLGLKQVSVLVSPGDRKSTRLNS